MYKLHAMMFLMLVLFGLAGCQKPSHDAQTISQKGVAPVKAANSSAILDRQTIRSDREIILNELICDLLTNPLLEDARNWYGFPKGKRVGLFRVHGLVWPTGNIPSYVSDWPTGYIPLVEGYEFEYIDPNGGAPVKGSRQLGIILQHFVFPLPTIPLNDEIYGNHAVVVTLLNVGGSDSDGYRGGGLQVYYNLENKDGKWRVEYEGSESQ